MEVKELINEELKNYSVNQMIPSERFLAMKYQCSRETVRKAYEHLRANDKIYKVQNVGWFVSNKKIQYYPSAIDNFNRYLSAQGFSADTIFVSAQHRLTDFQGREHFDPLFYSAGFWEIIRLRYADGVPVLLEYNYLPVDLFPNFLDYDVLPSVETVVMKHFKVSYTSSRLKIQKTAVTPEQSQHLGIPSTQTAIWIERISKSFDQVIEFDIEIWGEDKIEMILDVNA